MKSFANHSHSAFTVLHRIFLSKIKLVHRPVEKSCTAFRSPIRRSSHMAETQAQIPSIQLNDGTSIPIVSSKFSCTCSMADGCSSDMVVRMIVLQMFFQYGFNTIQLVPFGIKIRLMAAWTARLSRPSRLRSDLAIIISTALRCTKPNPNLEPPSRKAVFLGRNSS